MTEFGYDALDRQISQNDPYQRTSLKTYDPVGEVSQSYPDGNQVGYEHNGNNWLVTMTDARGGQTSYAYEADGQVSRIEMPNGTWRSNTYDDAGRLIKLFNGTNFNAGVVISYDYTLDAVGNRLQAIEEYTQGQVRPNLKTYRYNARSEVIEAVQEYEEDDDVASFSNIAPFIHLLAPGVSIDSSVPGGGIDNLDGTSMATPHVAGAWAIIKERVPNATVTDTLTTLRDIATVVRDTRPGAQLQICVVLMLVWVS